MNEVVTYSYDTWGKLISIKDINGTDRTNDSTFVGTINPFRYRGYYYDTETGLYYLQSRYYDPNTGRFLNADGAVSAESGLLGYNMFAYRNNNPVNLSDPSGCRATADDGTGAWVYRTNTGKVFLYTGNAKANSSGGAIKTAAQSAGDATAAHFINKIKDTYLKKRS